jgi:ATP-binding protein involved in chromosome partitioning
VTEAQVMAALAKVQEPELHKDLVALNMIRNVQIEGDRVSFTVVLTTPACPLRNQIEREAMAAVKAIPGVAAVEVRWDSSVPMDRRLTGRLDIGIRNAVAVGSGKGGVGKSTVAVNLAVALAQTGAQVGLLDADIYGPNVPLMMGVSGRPRSLDGKKILPPISYGVKLMSMGFLIDTRTPLIWRGPMIHGALRQFLQDVDWGTLDYLVVDLPPGTGDASLSLAQSLPLTGAILVTTPQAVSMADVVRGVTMFQHLAVPVLGVVENMSYYVCPGCGEKTYIFGQGGGRRVAEETNVPFLGEVPIDPRIRQGGDDGRPIVHVAPDSEAGQALRDVARGLAARVSVQNIRG